MRYCHKTETQKLSAAAAATVVIVAALLVPAVLGRLVLLLLCLLVLAVLALLLLTVLALILLGHGVLRFSAHRTAPMVLRVRQKNRQPAAEICRVAYSVSGIRGDMQLYLIYKILQI